MNPKTHNDRIIEILESLAPEDRPAIVFTLAAIFWARQAVMLCMSFGICATVGISLWFVPLVCVALAMTVGRLWARLRLGAVTRTLELIAATRASKGRE